MNSRPDSAPHDAASYDTEFVERLIADHAALEQTVHSLRERLAQITQHYEWLKRQLFGRKSEKRLVGDNPDQGLLFSALPKPEAPVATEEITYRRRRHKDRLAAVTDTGLRFGPDVPVETIEVSSPESEAIPPEHREVVGEKVSHRLARRASYVVLKYVRLVVKDKRDEAIHTPPAPANILDQSIVDVSFLAGMLVDKFCYHLPLYRQHQQLQQVGITLARATLTQWVQRSIELLAPLYEAQLRHQLQSRVLAMDETPIRAGPSHKTKGKMHQGWYWPIYGQDDEVSFIYSPTRGAEVVKKALGEHFKGVLLTDGYAAYRQYAAHRPEVTAANCWAHTRRQFERAKDIEPGAAGEALEIIGAMYRIESEIRERSLTGEAKLTLRQTQSAPLVAEFWRWCDRQCQRPDLVPTNPLAKALKYALQRVEELNVFLGEPDVPIDTNHLERALRPIPMGRKNWLFCWTELGARHVGIIQSLMTTCRLHSVNPDTYLVDVLQRISQHPANKVEDLTPRVWKQTFAANPLLSDIDRIRK